MGSLDALGLSHAARQLGFPILESGAQFASLVLQLRALRALFTVKKRPAKVVHYLIQITQSLEQTVRMRLNAFQLKRVRTPEVLNVTCRRRIMSNGGLYHRLLIMQ